MKDCRPNGDPGHELWVQGNVMSLYDIEDGVVEQGYQSSDADNGQGLRADGAEDNACQCRGEKCFVYAVEAVSVAVHV